MVSDSSERGRNVTQPACPVIAGASFFVIMLHASLFSLEDELEQATIEDLETV